MQLLLLILFAWTNTPEPNAGLQPAKLVVEVDGFRSSQGVLRAALYAGPSGFPISKKKAARIVDAPIHEGAVEALFPGIMPGDYAVVVYHDENGNGKLDQNLVGMPTEGYGFSNNVKPKLAIPTFDSAKFHVQGPETKITISMRY